MAKIDGDFLIEFFDRLQGPDGVGFGCGDWEKGRKFCVTCDEYDECESEKRNWRCAHDHTYTVGILKKMGLHEKHIPEFLSVCKKCGGYCDCEILFNSKYGLAHHYRVDIG